MEDDGDKEYTERITKLTSGFGEFVDTVKPNIDDNEKDRIVTAMEKFVESLKNSGSSSATVSDIDSVSASASMPGKTNFGNYDKFKGGLVEGQGDGAGCGRHALNNLFGAVYFTAYQDAAPYIIDEIKEAVEQLSVEKPFDLQKLCGYLFVHPYSGIESVNESDEEAMNDLLCPDNENYNVTVLVAALRFLGYNLQTDYLGKLSVIINQPDTFGILINTGGHWITVRKYDEKIYKLDSLIKKPEQIQISDIDNIYTKSIIVVKEFDEVYRKRYIGVEKMYHALSGIKKKALGKDFIMHWVHSLQDLFPDNVKLLYESTIKNIDENMYEDILDTLEKLENAMDPYVVNDGTPTEEQIEISIKESIQLNKELLELLGVNGSPAVGESKEQEAEGKSAILEKTTWLNRSLSELEAKISDLEAKAKAKAKAADVKLEVVKENEVDPLGGITVTGEEIGSQDLNLQPGEGDVLEQMKDDESIVDVNRGKEIEMIRRDKGAGNSGAPRRSALPKERSYLGETEASKLKKAGPNNDRESFPYSLRNGRPGFGGNTRRRNQKTRRSHTLKNKKQK